jgi:predicted PurR-regulated permease PerM
MSHLPAPTPTPAPTAAVLPLRVLAGLAILGMLYLARGVLEPVALAGMMGLMLAPILRRIRGYGFGQAVAAIGALVLAALLVAAVALVIAMQLGALQRELPRYESQWQAKIATLRENTVGRLREMQDRAGRLIDNQATPPATVQGRSAAAGSAAAAPGAASSGAARGGEDSTAVVRQLVALVWGPLGAVGIVVLVLIFALLEQDSLRDRLIRLAGGRDVRAATSAVNDATQRLSRYFSSQLSVNFGVAVVIWALLSLLRIPHPLIWALLAGVLRFIPYVGVPAAALCACAMAAVVAPGWALVLYTALVFVAVELATAYVVEPRLYGHATGLSPFSVVVAAIFWGTLWGPVGLLLSTPLTLCLVVAGRHVSSLGFLEILFGDAPALDLAQRFYQRTLSGNLAEVMADAHDFLRRNSLAAYCDKVVLAAFALAHDDVERGLMSAEQRVTAQSVIAQVFFKLSDAPGRRRRRAAVLDGDDFGLSLRQERERIEGRWQGPLDVAPGSVALCVSVAGGQSPLVAELLVRVLRSEHLDARHLTLQELANPPAGAKEQAVGTLFIVAAAAEEARPGDDAVIDACLARLPHAAVVSMMAGRPGAPMPTGQIAPGRVHRTAYSFVEAVALVRQGRPS